MFYEIIHLIQTYLISMQLIKKKEIFFFQFFLFCISIMYIIYNALLYI
jgi:hypothetical protein